MNYSTIHKIALTWFWISTFAFFGIESVLVEGDTKTATFLFLNLVASGSLTIATIIKLRSDD